MYELERTSSYVVQLKKLNMRSMRFIYEAMDILKETPTEFQDRIVHLSKRKDFNTYRYRIPGAYILYMVHETQPMVTLTGIQVLR